MEEKSKQFEKRFKTMMELLEYIKQANHYRITDEGLKLIAKTNIDHCKKYNDSEFDRIIAYLYKKLKKFPMIKDIDDAQEEIFFHPDKAGFQSPVEKSKYEIELEKLEKYYVPSVITHLRRRILNRWVMVLEDKYLSDQIKELICYEIGVLYHYGENVVNKMAIQRYNKTQTDKIYSKDYEFNFKKFITMLTIPDPDGIKFPDEWIVKIKEGYENGPREYERYCKKIGKEEFQTEKRITPDDLNDLINEIDEIPF